MNNMVERSVGSGDNLASNLEMIPLGSELGDKSWQGKAHSSVNFQVLGGEGN